MSKAVRKTEMAKTVRPSLSSKLHTRFCCPRRDAQLQLWEGEDRPERHPGIGRDGTPGIGRDGTPGIGRSSEVAFGPEAPDHDRRRRGGRAVECIGLENRQGGNSLAGSNPAPSAAVWPQRVERLAGSGYHQALL